MKKAKKIKLLESDIDSIVILVEKKKLTDGIKQRAIFKVKNLIKRVEELEEEK